jgi:predicted aspartyl protease
MMSLLIAWVVLVLSWGCTAGALAQVVDAAHTPAARAQVIAEFDIPKGPGLPIIRLTPENGRPDYFLLDTGFSRCAVDARRFPGLRFQQREKLATTGGTSDVALHDPPDYSVGPIRIADLSSVVVMDLAGISRAAGRPLAGIIGLDALTPFVLQLDPDDGRVRLMKSDAADHPEWGRRLPMTAAKPGVVTVRASIAGQAADFMVDTGAVPTAYVPAWWMDQLARRSKTLALGSMTANGIAANRCVRAGDFAVAEAKYPDPVVFESQSTRPILGLGFLARHVTTLDFPNGSLYLKDGKRFAAADQHDMSGLGLVRDDGQTVVFSLQPDSPAVAAGFQKGDVIVQIDGRDAAEYDLAQIRQLLASEDGKALRIGVTRGNATQQLTIRLQRAI